MWDDATAEGIGREQARRQALKPGEHDLHHAEGQLWCFDCDKPLEEVKDVPCVRKIMLDALGISGGQHG